MGDVDTPFPLTPALWLPKPATIEIPHKSCALCASWSPRRGGIAASVGCKTRAFGNLYVLRLRQPRSSLNVALRFGIRSMRIEDDGADLHAGA